MFISHNFAQGTVSTGYDASATSIALTSGHGARFPSTGPFRCVWWNQTDYPNPADDPNREIIEVTARSTDTLTIVRGQETSFGGLSASTKNTSAKTYGIALIHTAETHNELANPLTIARWTSLDNQPPAANYATFDTRNSIAVLDFDDSADESAIFVGVMPAAAVLTGGVAVYLHWMATTATSGAVIWEASIERSNTDLDSDSFATVAFASGSANGTSGIVTKTTISISSGNIDGVTAGDLFRLKISRDANGTNGTDDMTGDAELIAVELRGVA